jgi:hypothetical protein
VAVCWLAFATMVFVTVMVGGMHPEPLAASAALFAFLAVFAVIPWGIGWGLRYILAGPATVRKPGK